MFIELILEKQHNINSYFINNLLIKVCLLEKSVILFIKFLRKGKKMDMK